jgi:hypothetical protein
MSINDFKHSWEEAIFKATISSHPKGEQVNPDLDAAAGLPLRSGLHAGAIPLTYMCTSRCSYDCR